MKKASQILLTIAGVFHIVNTVAFFIAAIYMFVAGIAMAAFNLNWLFIPMEEIEEAEAMTALTLGLGILWCFLGLLFIGCGIATIYGAKVAFKAKECGNKKDYIACIVFGALFDTVTGIVGGIFGLIALNKENK